PVLVANLAVLNDPAPGHSFDGAALARADRLDAFPAAEIPADLHLDEGHQFALSGDQIEIVPAQLPAVRRDLPPLVLEPAGSGFLTAKAELVAGILEMGHGRGPDAVCIGAPSPQWSPARGPEERGLAPDYPVILGPSDPGRAPTPPAGAVPSAPRVACCHSVGRARRRHATGQ